MIRRFLRRVLDAIQAVRDPEWPLAERTSEPFGRRRFKRRNGDES